MLEIVLSRRRLFGGNSSGVSTRALREQPGKRKLWRSVARQREASRDIESVKADLDLVGGKNFFQGLDLLTLGDSLLDVLGSRSLIGCTQSLWPQELSELPYCTISGLATTSIMKSRSLRSPSARVHNVIDPSLQLASIEMPSLHAPVRLCGRGKLPDLVGINP